MSELGWSPAGFLSELVRSSLIYPCASVRDAGLHGHLIWTIYPPAQRPYCVSKSNTLEDNLGTAMIKMAPNPPREFYSLLVFVTFLVLRQNTEWPQLKGRKVIRPFILTPWSVGSQARTGWWRSPGRGSSSQCGSWEAERDRSGQGASHSQLGPPPWPCSSPSGNSSLRTLSFMRESTEAHRALGLWPPSKTSSSEHMRLFRAILGPNCSNGPD